MFFAILEGLETDSAKSSLGFLDDLIEGRSFFLPGDVMHENNNIDTNNRIQIESDISNNHKSDTNIQPDISISAWISTKICEIITDFL